MGNAVDGSTEALGIETRRLEFPRVYSMRIPRALSLVNHRGYIPSAFDVFRNQRSGMWSV
jgi:hypothetical protein